MIIIKIIKLLVKNPKKTITHFTYSNFKTLLNALRSGEDKEYIYKNVENKLNGVSSKMINEPLLITQQENLRNQTEMINTENAPQNTSNPQNTRTTNHSQAKLFVDSMKGMDKNKPLVICVSHNASRTGAPLIIYHISKRLKENFDCSVINILCEGGDLVSDFATIGPTHVLQLWTKPNELHHEMFLILDSLKEFQVYGAIVNSAESRRTLEFFYSKGIPTISLVHEVADYYKDNEWHLIDKYSNTIVFPSEYVHKKAFEKNNLINSNIFIKGQGLFKEELKDVDKTLAKKELCEKLNIDEDTIIVLSCGNPIARKGIDFFVPTAISTINQAKSQDLNIMFLWLGWNKSNEHFEWAFRDIATAEHSENIRFMGEVEDTSLYFGGSDIFFMCSKGDPFPCVVHEAMAARMPVIGFQGAGGFFEALDDDSGIIVDYGDISQITSEIINLAKDSDRIKEMGEHALDKIESDFDYNDYVEWIISKLNKLNQNELINLNAEGSLSTTGLSYVDKKVQIVFTLPSWWISGVNTFVELLVGELNKLGWDAYILFTTNESIYEKNIYMPKVPYRFLNKEVCDKHQIWTDLQNYLEKNSPCIFVPNYDYIASAISPILSKNVGILGVLHSDDVEHYEHAYRLGLYWNKIVSVSKTIQEKLLKYNPGFEKKSSFVYYGINKINKGSKKDFKSKTLNICYLGRIEEYQKRISDFIPIIKLLEERKLPYHIRFIGDGSQRILLEEKLSSIAGPDKISFLGRCSIEQVYEELAECHVYALTSDFEGLPLSMLEAMEMGCIPVVTDIKSGIGEVLKHGENALISQIANAEEFVDNLELLITDIELRETLSQHVKKTLITEQLYVEDMAQKYHSIISELYEEIKENTYIKNPPLVFKSKFNTKVIPSLDHC